MHKLTKVLFGTLAGLCMASVHAGYTSLPPPAGVSGGAGAFLYRAQATNAWAAGKVSDLIRVAGTPGSVPVGFRVSAARVGGYAASFLFRNPLTLTVAAAALLASDSISFQNGQWGQANPSAAGAYQSDGYKYSASPPGLMAGTRALACTAYVNYMNGNNDPSIRRYTDLGVTTYNGSPHCAIQVWSSMNGTYQTYTPVNGYADTACPSGYWRLSNGTCQSTQPSAFAPLTEPEFLPKVAPKILPDNAPYVLPDGTPIPVDDPVINPSEDAQPVPRPFFIPDGEPRAVPNPLYDPVTNPSAPPLTWERPGTNVVPAPTPTDPWRVDLQPRVLVAPDKTTVSDPNINNQPQTNRAPTASETKVCGLPDTPACKIDEAGTPEAETDQTQQKVDDSLSETKNFLDNIKTVLPELPALNWSFSLPTGCTPITISAFADEAPSLTSIDVCQFQPMIHELMSMLWAAAGLFGAVSMVFREATGSS